MEQESEQEEEPVFKVGIFYALYKGTGDTQWKDRFLYLIRKDGVSLPSRFWIILREGTWDEQEKSEACEVLAEKFDSSTPGTKDDVSRFQVVVKIFPVLPKNNVRLGFKEPGNFFNLARRAQTLVQSSDSARKRAGLTALICLSPQAFILHRLRRQPG